MSPVDIVALIGGCILACAAGFLFIELVNKKALAEEAMAVVGESASRVVAVQQKEIDRRDARDRGYIHDGAVKVVSPNWQPAILDPGAEPPVPDQRAELREWRAAWIEPNEEFILETDRILKTIEWERITSAAQEAGGANDRWEQSA